MRRLGVVAKTDAAEASGALRMLAGWAAERGLALLVEKETADLAPDLHLATARKADLPSHSDLLIVLGGDGTLLSMARAVGDLAIPIVGVNLGDLGFLSATTLDEMIPALDALLRGEMVIEERMMLATRVHREGRVVGTWLGLNDTVITKAAMSRIINLSVSIEGQHAILYRADGQWRVISEITDITSRIRRMIQTTHLTVLLPPLAARSNVATCARAGRSSGETSPLPPRCRSLTAA